jgi:uncharacterized cupredoxin-like copper-binding protein
MPVQGRLKRGRRVATVLVVLAGMGLGACSSAESPATSATAAPAAAKATTVGVTLKEFGVTPAQPWAPAGAVTFSVQNSGLIPHELVVVKSDLPVDKLPQFQQKLVEETKVEVVSKTAPFDAGQKQEITATLQPGKYILLCNVASHYISGMFTGFEVTSDGAAPRSSGAGTPAPSGTPATSNDGY